MKKPMNVRVVNKRTCHNCRWRIVEKIENSIFEDSYCLRTPDKESPWLNFGGEEQAMFEVTCDRWGKQT